MDRIAIISDIHGNIPALNAVLDDIKVRGINHIICLGDIAGKGPSSAEAVDLIRENCQEVVKGNWDYYLSEQNREIHSWHQDKLGKERLDYLKALPIYVEFYMSGRLIRLSHASPNDLFYRIFSDSDRDEKLKLFEPTKDSKKFADVVGYGDIHGAYTQNFRGKTIFNVGSVGNPLEIPQSSYAIIEGEYNSEETASFTISFVRLPYDIEEAISHALETDMPEREAYINELRTAVYRGRAKDNNLEYINGKVYRYAIGVKNDELLRENFNKLTSETYGFTFESWYRDGYWSDNYIPYVLLDDDTVISNVSVYVMDYIIHGQKVKCIQIGTVMTHPDYRHQGLNRIIMNRVLGEWKDKSDLIYLYANDSVIEFYPKFEFIRMPEYEYSFDLEEMEKSQKTYTISKLSMSENRDREFLENMIENSVEYSSISLINKLPLTMFYCTKFMNENIYCVQELNAVVIAEYDTGVLVINEIFSTDNHSVIEIALALATDDIYKVILGFTPKDIDNKIYNVSLYQEEDTTLFVLKDSIEIINKDNFRFPILSHT